MGITAVGAATVDFDKSMRNVNSIAQLNERQFQKLQKSVLGLAGPTAQAPKTIAEGMYDLVSSGFKAGEALQIVEKSAKAATAGLTTADVSTKAVAAVLNAYHLPAKRAGIVSDQLFRTVDRGVISFEDLAMNVGDVLPFASSLGVGLDQVGASIATMTKAGISAPETMTRVKNVMVAMLKPGEGLKKALKELGVESGEQLIKTKGFQGGLEALIGTTDGSKKAVAKLFPEIRAMGGALALTGKNAKGARNDLEGMRQSAGATDKALSQQSKSISYAWNQIKAEVTAAAIGIGSQAIPAIMNFVREVRTGTGVGGDFRHAIENIGTAVAPFAIAIGQVSLAVGKLGLDFAQTQAAMVLVGAAVGALTGRMVALGVAFAAGKIIPFAAAVARTVSVLQSAIAVSGALRTAMILLTASTRGMGAAMMSTGIGALAVLAGTAIGALIGFKQSTNEATVSQQQFRDAILGVRDALDAYKDIDGKVTDARLAAKASALGVAEAEKALADGRARGATGTELERLDLNLAQARRQAKKDTAELTRTERDANKEREVEIGKAKESISKMKGRVTGQREHAKSLREEREDLKKYIEIDEKHNRNSSRLSGMRKRLVEVERELGTTQGRTSKTTLDLRREQLRLEKATGGSKSRIKELRDEIRLLKGKKVDVTVKTKLDADDLKFQFKGAIDGVMAGIPFQYKRRPKPKRKGGWATFQDGGMVPSILSPGEVGVLPNGSSFTVPGARVAADTYPMMLPQGTAVLTDHGQQLAAMGMPLNAIISNQAPHFRDGGIVGATAGAASLRAAGIENPRQLVVMTATGGRETGGTYDPKTRSLKPNANGTIDHGWLQINDIWAKDPVGRRYWDDRYTFEGGSKLAKRVATKQGPAAWRLNGWNADSTISKYMPLAQRAVKRAMDGKGFSYSKVTQPKITHPLLQSMLQPLTDDALLGGIEAGREGTARWRLLGETLDGIVPEAEDRPTREKVSVSGAPGSAAGGFKPGGGWGGSKNLVMRAIRGLGQSWTYKRSVAINGNQDSDHNTWNKTAYAADGTPGSDSVFNTIGKRLGISAAKGSWNSFNNAPLDGYRSQLLWHAPDGSHTDHVHLGIRKMRKGGLAGMRVPQSPEVMAYAAKRKKRIVVDGYHWKPFNVEEARRAFNYHADMQAWAKKEGAKRQYRHHEKWRMKYGNWIAHRNANPNKKSDPAVDTLREGPRRVKAGTGGFVTLAGLRDPRKPKRKKLTVARLVKQLGGSPGTAGADKLTRQLAGKVKGRDMGQLLRGERIAEKRIRAMAGKRSPGGKSFTGTERIKARRFRGALSLLQDEMGRPIGRELAISDRVQGRISDALDRKEDELVVAGIDPESDEGLSSRRDLTNQSLGQLNARKKKLNKQLARAKKTGNKAAVRQVQGEIKEVDREQLSLRRSLIDLTKAMNDNTDELDAMKELAEQMKALREEMEAQRKFAEGISAIEAREAVRFMADLVSGQVGAQYSQRSQTPGDGSAARY